ncbi:TetR/AcrR family transcriptional regulator [Dickeya dadantii]|uniref:TetR/AcrR family transcriptional regulator n=1 Tax=Dickeya dadantii TaxID=204038 RepID=UPI001CF30BB9|nr:TetR/AcrR family transcriptional regulator [Dickeya dadantii]MCA7015176.1 TetR/AcrR family transcriptional regulator [Dickeya dadantii]
MNDKRQQLIATALTLFNQKGINSVGINEVLEVSGVAKKTLYHHFPGKNELVLATLAYRDQIFMTWLSSALEQAATPHDVVQRLFHALTDWFRGDVKELSAFHGCFFINTAAEIRDPSSPIAQYCREHKQKVRLLLKQHLPTTSEAFIDLLCLLKEGATVAAFVGQDLDAAEKCIPLAEHGLTTAS